MGKPYPEAIGEIANCAGVFRYYAEMARDEAGKIAGTTQAGSFQFARYEPYGVSVHIMPYNFPILLMCWTVAASLAAGNACVVKPAEATTLSTLEYMKMFRPLPPGLVSCLPGGAATAKALIASDRTHAVAFTGSVAAGRAVAVACAERMKPCVIEAGGSDPMIVTKHAPLEVAAAGAVTAAFHLSGQVCTSAERFFVVGRGPRSLRGPLRRAHASTPHRQRYGRKRDRPAGQRGGARARSCASSTTRVAHGATAVTGGAGAAEPECRLVLRADHPHRRHARHGDLPRGVLRPGRRDLPGRRISTKRSGSPTTARSGSAPRSSPPISTRRWRPPSGSKPGMVWVNNPLIDNDALPFGGWKASGLGRELGRQGLDAFRRSKMVVIDHKPAIQGWWYPYPDSWFPKHGGRKHV